MFLRRRTLLTMALLLVSIGAFHLSEHGLFRSGQVAADEQVVFFPGVARLGESGETWFVPVHGRVFEPEHDDLLRNAAAAVLIEALGIDDNATESAVFVERLRAVTADDERGKELAVAVGETDYALPTSTADGQFQAVLELPAALVDAHASDGELAFSLEATDGRVFRGRALLLESEGLSVISDIDDTVKISHVTDRAKLLRATFLEPFVAVPGMAAVYRRWASGGARFHFVSSSPWQLYEPLASFLGTAGFPQASFHLKRLRFKGTSVLALFDDPVESKLAAIEPLFAGWQKRRFVLVGDSGERDPEIYGEAARRYPDQVHRIFIRNVTGESSGAERYQRAFREVPAGIWSVFRNADELGL